MKLEKLNIFIILTFIGKRIVLPLFGILFIIVGIIGLFIPIVQGIAFIILGLALLGNKRLKKFIYKKILSIKWLKKKHLQTKHLQNKTNNEQIKT